MSLLMQESFSESNRREDNLRIEVKEVMSSSDVFCVDGLLINGIAYLFEFVSCEQGYHMFASIITLVPSA